MERNPHHTVGIKVRAVDLGRPPTQLDGTAVVEIPTATLEDSRCLLALAQGWLAVHDIPGVRLYDSVLDNIVEQVPRSGWQDGPADTAEQRCLMRRLALPRIAQPLMVPGYALHGSAFCPCANLHPGSSRILDEPCTECFQRANVLIPITRSDYRLAKAQRWANFMARRREEAFMYGGPWEEFDIPRCRAYNLVPNDRDSDLVMNDHYVEVPAMLGMATEMNVFFDYKPGPDIARCCEYDPQHSASSWALQHQLVPEPDPEQDNDETWMDAFHETRHSLQHGGRFEGRFGEGIYR